MSIRPAVQPKEWERWEAQGEIRLLRGGIRRSSLGDVALFERGTVEVIREDIPAVIAALNASLPDHDDRKITRDHLFCLEEVIANFRAAYETAGGDNPRIAAQYAPTVEHLLAILDAYIEPERR